MNSILNYNSGCFDVASEVGSPSDFGPIVGLDVASGHAEDHHVLCFDISCDRSMPADRELVVWQFDTALDVTVQIQISLAEYFASDSYISVNQGRLGPRKRGVSSRQVGALPFLRIYYFRPWVAASLHQFAMADRQAAALEDCETGKPRVVAGVD
jgi:hypothetical protein